MQNELKIINDLNKEMKSIMTRINEQIQRINNMERWTVIDEYSTYSISTHGRVRNDITGRVLKLLQHKRGYIYVRLYKANKGISKCVHRLVAKAFLKNANKKPCVDHINNNKCDNNLYNLRWVTYTENNRNTSVYSSNTSGVIGVNWHKRTQMWRAYISIMQGKHKHLGYFNTIEEAVEARAKAVNKYFGEYAHSSKILIH